MENETRTIKMTVTKTNQFDVVLGRGQSASKRPGNVYFRQLASEHAATYAMASTIKEKSDATGQLLAQVEAKGGRFLQAVAGTNANGDHSVGWIEASRKVVHRKAKQAIRDSVKSRKKPTGKKKLPTQTKAQSSRLASGQVGKSNTANIEGSPLQEPINSAVSSMPEHQRPHQKLQLHHLRAYSGAFLQRLEHDDEHKQLQQNHQQQQAFEQEPMVQPYQVQRQYQEMPQPRLQNHDLSQSQELHHDLVHFQKQRHQPVDLRQQALSEQQHRLRTAYSHSGLELGELLHCQQQQQDLIRFRQKQQELAHLQAKVQQQQRELDLCQQRFLNLRNSLRVPGRVALPANPSLLHFQSPAGSIDPSTTHQLRASMAAQSASAINQA